jgi:hypothetical protein
MWRNIELAHNKLYRNFIILQEDQRGYSHSNDKALSGYAKVEAKGDKCKVSFYAQNLRQEDNYSMVLICCKRDLKQLVDLGPLAINGVGKGDTSKEYYVNNIAGLGMSYDKISGAAICKVKDNEPEFIMHGFMNGEDSTDNWRKFKLVKVDSKKYINKLDAEPKKNEIISSDINDKAMISQSKGLETKTGATVKIESAVVERKNDEVKPQTKESIEPLGTMNSSDSKVEDKQQNRIPEIKESVTETVNIPEEDRNKCKEVKKHDKCDDCDKHDKHDKCEKVESIEDAINNLAKKLDTYDGVIDLRINNIHEDVIVYGFIKDKKSCDCKWKKFKVEKKCRNESEDFNNIQSSSKRIEENFKLDKLNEIDKVDRRDRLDILDFDEYENDIKQMGTGNMGQTGTANMGQMNMGNMGQTGTMNMSEMNTGNMGQTGTMNMGEMNTGNMGQIGTMNMGEMNTGNMGQTGTMNMGQMGTGNMNQTGTMNMGQMGSGNMQQATSNQNFKLTGEVSLYFEKLAEDFEPYNGSLADINYCKLYKINVNSIDDLSDDSNYNQYTLAYYPMLNYYPYISKKGHFLLGYKCNGNGEMKYIVYAIPGSKDKSEQPYGGRTGFVTWTIDDKSGRGYWLMFYDFKNSSIVIPTK